MTESISGSFFKQCLTGGALLLMYAFHLVISLAADSTSTAVKPTVILELFTSQGCSSCPPADALLSRVGRETFAGGTVIPLAFHVDYWNRIGWTDPFSSAQWSARQNQYAAVRNANQVYTPQLVLNGGAQLVGNNERLVRDEIARQWKTQLKTAPLGHVVISGVVQSETSVSLNLTASLAGLPAMKGDVVVVLFENGVTTVVRSGENSGRKLVNDHIVRSLTRSFTLQAGGPAVKRSIAIALHPSWRRDSLGIAAFIQNPKTMAIYGAGSTTLSVTQLATSN